MAEDFVVALCACGFALSFVSPALWGVPVSKFSPNKSQLLSRFTFLTSQTNFIGMVYYCVLFGCSVLRIDTGIDSYQSPASTLFPLVFALGAFLTIAYYGLDHFNPESLRLRAMWCTNGYPYIHRKFKICSGTQKKLQPFPNGKTRSRTVTPFQIENLG